MLLLLGDCLEQLKSLQDNSIDAVVTDPPYGLSFMGKKWDYDVPSVDLWREVFRVLKPGGHLLSFGGTRTYHRMVVNIEDAGFEIRDQIQWLYGSGFPKSTDVSKRIDKEAGALREITHSKRKSDIRGSTVDGEWQGLHKPNKGIIDVNYTAPATAPAKQWQGFGSALKPANEPICLARKPLEKGLTLAQNVLKWGCGGLNIDGCRIGFSDNEPDKRIGTSAIAKGAKGSPFNGVVEASDIKMYKEGRWPANIILDEVAAEMLDEQSGVLHSRPNKNPKALDDSPKWYENKDPEKLRIQHDISGGASRFFYVAKASKRERNAGLEGMEAKQKYSLESSKSDSHDCFTHGDKNPCIPQANNHPTVKPIKLMEYLCKLITPPKGTVLDPFMGSGSTGIAAKNLGFEFVGIEREPEYFEIAKRRIEHDKAQLELESEAV